MSVLFQIKTANYQDNRFVSLLQQGDRKTLKYKYYL